MGKIAWLIASDLHLYYKNISSHLNYLKETEDIKEQLLQLALKYKRDGFNTVNLLLMGDVFHRSYANVEAAVYDCSFFVLWREKFGECFSVVGNHELSFYKSNPFFSLVKTIESKKVASISDRVYAPLGLLSIIRVVDVIECGNVKFFFNHNRCGISRPEKINGINIGLFHQDIVCKQIRESAESRLGSSIWGETIKFEDVDIFDNYDYCFFGHMHKVYGTWKMDNGTTLCYLASLGRSDVSEINNNFLERNVPVVKVIDDEFTGIDDNFITLGSYEECVDVSVANANHEKYELSKVNKLARLYSPLDDDPLKSLKAYYADNEMVLTIIDGLLSDLIDPIGDSLNKRFRRDF